MATTPFLTGGRVLMSLIALSTSISCYIADFNETHVFNERWPGHARFHNGQTMSLGLTLGLVTLYLIWRPVYNRSINPLDSTFLAAVVGSLYWVAGVSAILYPGTTWIDPEFGEAAPQKVAFPLHFGVLWVGYWFTARALKASKSA